MLDKQGQVVTTSLTLIDTHDIARSSKTYGAKHFFIVHPSAILQNLAGMLLNHWKEGYGASYNPDRKSAIDILQIQPHLSDLLTWYKKTYEVTPKLIATSAKEGERRVTFSEMAITMQDSNDHYLLLLGTGWGMTEELLQSADYILEPINGPTEYNHLSVRSACAVLLDRLFAARSSQ